MSADVIDDYCAGCARQICVCPPPPEYFDPPVPEVQP